MTRRAGSSAGNTSCQTGLVFHCGIGGSHEHHALPTDEFAVRVGEQLAHVHLGDPVCQAHAVELQLQRAAFRVAVQRFGHAACRAVSSCYEQGELWLHRMQMRQNGYKLRVDPR